MTSKPVSVNKDILAAKALSIMNNKKITSLLVNNKNNPINTNGNRRIVSGSFSTKLPSNNGLIKAAKAVSVTANIAIANIDIIKMNLCSKV